MKRNIVIYRYIRPDKNEPFYIGIGSMRRARDTKFGRTEFFKRIIGVNDNEVELDILEDELTWEEAAEKEKWWIAFYGRIHLGTGTLCNLTDGGEGRYGYGQTPESIQKGMETKRKNGNLQPMLGRTHTKESRLQMGESRKGHIVSEETRKKISESSKGRIFSKEHLEKMSIAMKNRPPISDETRRKLSESLKNRDFRHSEESRKRISDKLKGHSFSEESLRKLREHGSQNKKIINTETNEIFISAKEAMRSINYTDNKFYKRMSGRIKDENFHFKYINE